MALKSNKYINEENLLWKVSCSSSSVAVRTYCKCALIFDNVHRWLYYSLQEATKHAKNLPAFPADHSAASLMEPIYGHKSPQTSPVLTHNPPNPPVSSVEATICRKCVHVVDIPFVPKIPMTHPFGLFVLPDTRSHPVRPMTLHDVIATPDPQPDFIPASRRGTGAAAGGKALHNIQVILKHLEQISPGSCGVKNKQHSLVESPEVSAFPVLSSHHRYSNGTVKSKVQYQDHQDRNEWNWKVYLNCMCPF